MGQPCCLKWLFYGGCLLVTSRFPVDYIAQYNDGAKREVVPRNIATEVSEYKNTRSDFKCCNYWLTEKNESNMLDYSLVHQGPKGDFPLLLMVLPSSCRIYFS